MRALRHIALALVGALFVGCGAGPLTRLEPIQPQNDPITPKLGRVIADFSGKPSLQIAGDLFLTFVIDTSGSNIENDIHGQTLPGSDPNNERFNILLQFVKKFETLPADEQSHLHWSLIKFGTTAHPITNGFITSLSTFEALVQHERDNPTNDGSTNYVAAIGAATTEISNSIADRNRAGTKTEAQYIVFEFTDGLPYVVANGEERLQTREDDIYPVIDGLTALGKLPNVIGVTLNMGFYCNTLCPPEAEGVSAEALTNDMAKRGGGQNYAFEHTTIDLNNYTIPIQDIGYALREVFVRNRNAAWYKGELKTDSTMSGLADEYKKAKKYDLTTDDSDGDGIRDMIQELIGGDACPRRRADGACIRVTAPQHANCAADLLPGPGIHYRSTVLADVNDCELRLLNIDPTTGAWNNGNRIPFPLVAWNRLSFDFTTGDASFIPMGDGITNYQKLKAGLDPYTAYSADVRKYQYTVTHLGKSDDQELNLYRVQVDNIPIVTADGSDMIELFFEQSAAITDPKTYLRTAKKRFDPNASDPYTIEFTDADFQ